MPRITELQAITGQETDSQDLFLVVDLSAGSSGTKHITREQVVRGLEEEPFNNLQVFSGEFTDPDITLTQTKPSTVIDTDYFPLTDASSTTYRYSLGTLAANISSRISSPRYIFVSNRSVSTNRNGSMMAPFATIADAVSAVQAGSPTVILVEPGSYSTTQITVPRDTTILGLSPESVIITSTTQETNLFLMSSGSRIQNFTVLGLRQNSVVNPTLGFVAAFLPGETITKIPVVENVVNLSNMFTDVDFPVDAANGNPNFPLGSGLIFSDYSVLSSTSSENTITSIANICKSQNAVVFHARNSGRIIDTSSVIESARITCLSSAGGRIDMSDSFISYGDYTFVAQGSRQTIRVPRVTGVIPESSATADLMVANKSAIMGAINSYITTNSYSSDAAFLTDYASKWIDTLSFNLRDGSDLSTRSFISTKFNWNGQSLIAGNTTLTTRLLDVLSIVRQSVGSVVTITTPIANFFDNLYSSIAVPVYNSPSYNSVSSMVSANNISFYYCGSGVSYLSKTALKASLKASDTILKTSGGYVQFTGKDQEGNEFFQGYMIEGRTGKITGRKLASSIKQATRRIANSKVIL